MTRPKHWPCRICGRAFATEKALYRHERYCEPPVIGAGETRRSAQPARNGTQPGAR